MSRRRGCRACVFADVCETGARRCEHFAPLEDLLTRGVDEKTSFEEYVREWFVYIADSHDGQAERDAAREVMRCRS